MRCPSCGAEARPDADACFRCGKNLYALTQGAILDDRYEVIDALGRGGMGMVYKAHDRELDETVALKVLRAEIAQAPEVVKRFRNEIRLARRVRHRNVCAIHEYGQHEHLRFIVMEFVTGVDFKQILRAYGPLPFLEAADVAQQVAEALEAIHEAGIVHRDLKTPNIMRDDRGVVRLMDFGIAKQFETETSTGATATGMVIGTPEYMSPEQARAEKVDGRSDIYSLGIVLFELLTGSVPFRGETAVATLMKQISEAPHLDHPRIPTAMVPVLTRALAKSRDERFASGRAFAAALEKVRLEKAAPEAPRTVIDVPAHHTRGALAEHTVPVAAADPVTTLPTPVPTPVPTGVPTAESTRPVVPAPLTVSSETVRPTLPSPPPPRAGFPPSPLTRPVRPPVPGLPRRALAVSGITAAVVFAGAIGWNVQHRATWTKETTPVPPVSVVEATPSSVRLGDASPPGRAFPNDVPPRVNGTAGDERVSRDGAVRPSPLVARMPALPAARPTPSLAAERPAPAATHSVPPPTSAAAPLTNVPLAPSVTVAAAPPTTIAAPVPTAVAASATAAPPSKVGVPEPAPSPASGVPAHGALASGAPTGAPAKVLLNIKPWADVSVDGKSFGRTRSLTLPAGTYRFVFAHPDYEPLKRAFTLASAQTLTVNVDMRDEAVRLKK